MRRAALLVVLLCSTAYAGCFERTIVNSPRFSINGISLNVPLAAESADVSGELLYRLENPANLTFAVSYSFNGSTDKPSPLTICLILEDGDIVYPSTLRREVAAASDAYVRSPAGSYNPRPRLYDQEEAAGVEVLNTTGTRGWLLIAWANATGPLTVETHWKDGTQVQGLPVEPSILTATLQDFEGGATVGTNAATQSANGLLRLGASGQRYLAVVAVVAGEASAKVELSGPEGKRMIEKQPDGHLGLRYVTEVVGPVEATVTATGAGRIQVFLAFVALPSPLMPPGKTWQRSEA